MPVYDFVCKNCGMIELTKKMMDPNPTICPRCKSEGLTRRFTPINKVMYGDHYVSGRKPNYGKHGMAEIVPRS